MVAADRLYRLLLLAYPAGFRHEYGREMALVFRDLRREEQYRGGFRPLRVWLDVLADLGRSAVEEHMETLFHGRGPGERGFGLVWLASAGAAVALLIFAWAFLRVIARHPLAQGPDLRPVSETFLFVVIGALAPVVLGVLLSVGIALTVRKQRLRFAKNR